MDRFHILTFSIICRLVEWDQTTTISEKTAIWRDPMLCSPLIGLYSVSYTPRGSEFAIQEGQFANEYSWYSFSELFFISTIFPPPPPVVSTSVPSSLNYVDGWCPLSSVHRSHLNLFNLILASIQFPPWMPWSTSDLISCPPYLAM